MRLIGCASIADLSPELVDPSGLRMHTTGVPVDTLGLGVYDPLVMPQEMPKAKL